MAARKARRGDGDETTNQDSVASTDTDQTSTERTRRNRRAHGEGSVFWREDRKRWVVEIDYGIVNGRRKKVPRYFKTQEEAIAAQQEARQAQADGVANLDRPARFGDFLTYWLDEVVMPSERALSTKSSYRDNVENHVRPGLGKIRVVDLKHEDVQRFLNGKAVAGYSTSTMRTLRTIISQALDEAVITEKASRNVAKTVRVPKARKPRRQVSALNRDDGLQLLAAAEPTRFYAVYVLLAMVGLRRGEVLALRWRDFNESAGTLRVELQVTRVRGVQGLIVGPTKSRAGQRTIALPGKCIDVLKTHRRHLAAERQAAGKRWEENGLIFPNTVGRYQEPRALNTHLAALCKEAGLRHLGPHALRHTAATMAYALGVDWKQIQAMLGHTMLSTTMDIYVDMVEDVSRDAATKLDAWFDTADDAEDQEDDEPSDPDDRAEAG